MSGRPTDDPRVNVRRTAPSVPAAHRLADDACGPRSRARGPTRPELAVAPLPPPPITAGGSTTGH